MRVVIDLQGAQGKSRFREIERYSLYLALAIAHNKGSHDILIVLNGLLTENIGLIRLAFSKLLPPENIRVWFSYKPSDSDITQFEDMKQYNTAELIYAAFLASLEPDVILITGLSSRLEKNIVHSMGLEPYHIPTAVICYDLVSLAHKKTNFQLKSLYYQLYQKTINILKNADQYLTFSPALNHVLIENLDIDSYRITNIQVGVSNCFRSRIISNMDRMRINQKFGLNKPFLVYVDTNDESSNYLVFIKSFALLPQEIINHYQVLVIGSTLEENQNKLRAYAKIYDLNLADIILADRIEDEDLIELYNSAELCIFAPCLENFALCALEAISCGAPVIGAHLNPLLKEIEPDRTIFDPLNIFALTNKIVEVLTDTKIRERLVSRSLEQANLFSYEENAKIAISSLEHLYTNYNKKHPKPKSYVCHKEWLIEKIAGISVRLDNIDLIGVANAIALNHSGTRKPHLLIDISGLVIRDHKTGIQRVVRSIITELLVSPPQGYIVELVYADSQSNGSYRYARRFKKKFLGLSIDNCVDDIVTVAAQDVFLGLDLAHRVVLNNQSFYKHLQVIGAKVYFVVYDLLPILCPEVFPAEVESLHSQWMNVLAESDGILCISQAVADEVVEWLDTFGPKRICPLNIGWFHLGADLANSVPSMGLPDNVEKILNIISSFPTFLMVGTIEPRKRQLQVLLAFERLWGQGYQVNLVIVGKYGWSVDLLVEMLQNHPENGRRLFWLSQTSDEFLDKIYTSASCLIAASAGEGFGLPLIEAAQHGIPIIARDIPVFREVAGEHAFYFNGNSAVSLANKVAEWLSLEKPPSSKEMPWITWKQSKKQLLDVVLGNNWYCQWKSNNSLRFCGNDIAIISEVGERLKHSIKTTGKSGYLIYGPRIEVEKGLYEVKLYGRWNNISEKSYIEFTKDKGETVLLNKKLNEVLITSNTALLAIWIQEFRHELEIRVWVDSETEIEILRIVIKAVEEHLGSSNLIVAKTVFSNETLT